MIKIIIDSQYHRKQFDDWLAGGKAEYKGKTYYWSAQNNNYGFGWEIEPIDDADWCDITENEFNQITRIVKECLYKHKIEYNI